MGSITLGRSRSFASRGQSIVQGLQYLVQNLWFSSHHRRARRNPNVPRYCRSTSSMVSLPPLCSGTSPCNVLSESKFIVFCATAAGGGFGRGWSIVAEVSRLISSHVILKSNVLLMSVLAVLGPDSLRPITFRNRYHGAEGLAAGRVEAES